MPTVDAEARSRAARAGWRARRMRMALAGDRDAGIVVVLDQLGVSGALRARCVFLFAAGTHLNPLQDSAAVLHAAQLALQAESHMEALDAEAAAGGPMTEWRAKLAGYTSQAALRSLATLGLTPATRAGGLRRPDRGRRAVQEARAAEDGPDALAPYRRPGVVR